MGSNILSHERVADSFFLDNAEFRSKSISIRTGHVLRPQRIENVYFAINSEGFHSCCTFLDSIDALWSPLCLTMFIFLHFRNSRSFS